MKRTLIILLLLFILSSCTSLKAGWVCDKRHEPARVFIQYLPVRVGSVTVMVPNTIVDTEDFVVTICNEEGDIQDDWYLTQAQWESVSLREYLIFEDTMEMEDEQP